MNIKCGKVNTSLSAILAAVSMLFISSQPAFAQRTVITTATTSTGNSYSNNQTGAAFAGWLIDISTTGTFTSNNDVFTYTGTNMTASVDYAIATTNNGRFIMNGGTLNVAGRYLGGFAGAGSITGATINIEGQNTGGYFTYGIQNWTAGTLLTASNVVFNLSGTNVIGVGGASSGGNTLLVSSTFNTDVAGSGVSAVRGANITGTNLTMNLVGNGDAGFAASSGSSTIYDSVINLSATNQTALGSWNTGGNLVASGILVTATAPTVVGASGANISNGGTAFITSSTFNIGNGIAAYVNATSNPAAFTGSNLLINLGNSSKGISGVNGAKIYIYSSTIIASGSNNIGVHEIGGSTLLSVKDSVITGGTGVGFMGAYLDYSGSMSLLNVKITSDGANSTGVRSSAGSTNNFTGTNVNVLMTGSNSNGAAFTNAYVSSLQSSTFTTTGNNSNGVYFNSGTFVDIGNIVVSASGAGGTGVLMDATAKVTGSKWDVTTTGTNTNALAITGNAYLDLTNSSLTTTANGANTVNLYRNWSTGGIVFLGSSTLTTSGSGAIGVAVDSGGISGVTTIFTGSALTITTSGSNAYGLLAKGGGTMALLASSTVKTSADGAHGMVIDGANSFIATDSSVSVTTTGTGAHGLVVRNGGSMLIDGSGTNTVAKITVNGQGSAVLNATGANSRLTVQNSALNSTMAAGANTYGAKAENSGRITFDNGSWTGATTIWAASTGTIAFVGTGSGNGSRTIIDNTGAIDVTASATGATIGSLEGAGRVLLGTSTLTVGGNTTAADIASTTYSGTISGAGALVHQGTGTLTLTATNIHTGATQIDAGAVVLRNGNSAGTGDLGISTVGTVYVSPTATGNFTLANTSLSGKGLLDINLVTPSNTFALIPAVNTTAFAGTANFHNATYTLQNGNFTNATVVNSAGNTLIVGTTAPSGSNHVGAYSFNGGLTQFEVSNTGAYAAGWIDTNALTITTGTIKVGAIGPGAGSDIPLLLQDDRATGGKTLITSSANIIGNAASMLTLVDLSGTPIVNSGSYTSAIQQSNIALTPGNTGTTAIGTYLGGGLSQDTHNVYLGGGILSQLSLIANKTTVLEGDTPTPAPDAYDMKAKIIGTGTLFINATGTIALSGTNTNSGGIIVHKGTLLAATLGDADWALGNSTVYFDNNAAAQSRLLFATSATMRQREYVNANSVGTLDAGTGNTLTVTASANSAQGSAVFVDTNGTFNSVGNITYKNNTATNQGGAIYMNTGGALNFATGTIAFTNNRATNGGGAIYSAGNIIISGSSSDMLIDSNTSTIGSGGAFYSGSNINIGGNYGNIRIDSNTSGTTGGALYASNAINISATTTGTLAITKNTGSNGINGSGGALYAGSGITLTGTYGSILVDRNQTINGNGGAFYSGSGININVATDKLAFTYNTATNGANISGAAMAAAKGDIIITGTYGNIDFSNNMANMMGGVIKRGSGSDTGTVKIDTVTSGTLNIANNSITPGSVSGGAFLYNMSGDFVLSGSYGTINIANNQSGFEGAIMTAGKILINPNVASDMIITSNSTGGTGGALFASSTITIAGKYQNILITKNAARATSGNNGGGAIHSDYGGAVVFSATTSGTLLISENTSGTVGGAIDSGAATSIGGTYGSIVIASNNAKADGGAIYSLNAVTISPTIGGNLAVTKNTATGNGGAIYSNAGGVTINARVGGTMNLSNNTSNGSGGFLYSAGKVALTGSYANVLIDSNKADGNGGAIYSNANGVTINTQVGGTFALTRNTGSMGGAIYSAANGIVIDGTYGSMVLSSNTSSNVSTTAGGAAALMAAGNSGTIAISGSYGNLLVEDNKSSALGGAFYTYNGSNGINIAANVSGTMSISRNTGYEGGAFWVRAGGINMSGTMASILIDANTSTGNGGAFFSGGSISISTTTADTLTITRNNSTTGNGGAFYSGNKTVITGSYANVLINSNTAGGTGGAIHTQAGGLVINAQVAGTFALTGNTGSSGGAVYSTLGGIVIDGNYGSMVISSNTATRVTTLTGGAGAFYAAENVSGSIAISGTYGNLLIESNKSSARGGAFFAAGNGGIQINAQVSDTVSISKNSGYQGGALFADKAGSVISLSGSYGKLLITSNTATNVGGAFYSTGGITIDANVANIEIRDNTSLAGIGGGAFHSSTNFVLNLADNATLTATNNKAVNTAGGGFLYTAGGSMLFNIGNNATATIGDANSVTNVTDGIAAANVAIALTKTGNGILTLNARNTYTGTTYVSGGKLVLNGYIGSFDTIVAASSTLAGTGTAAGNAIIQNGGHLAPGNSPGTLTFGGTLTLNDGANLDFDLNDPTRIIPYPTGTRTAQVTNDLIEVGRDVTLLGTSTLNITSVTTFARGEYDLIHYQGTRTGDATNITIGNVLVSGSTWNATDKTKLTVLVDEPQWIKLGYGVNLGVYNYWDGTNSALWENGAANGGSGTWYATNGSTDYFWTTNSGTFNGEWADAEFAIFKGTSGTVTVDGSRGNVNFAGAQFQTDGYVLTGGTLFMSGTYADVQLNINDGVTTTIDTRITGTYDLVKVGGGTLVLTGTTDTTKSAIVDAGKLLVDGVLTTGSVTTVNNGAILGGSGTINGPVNVNAGAALAGGDLGTAGNLHIDAAGGLTLDNASSLAMDLGQANTVGGPLNDLITITGNLVLGGTLNVAVTPTGSFGGGMYRLIDYTGDLTNNTLALGVLPTANTGENYFVQTSVANQVNLFYFGGSTSGTTPYSGPTPQDPTDPTNFNGKVNYWDGSGIGNDGTIAGGNGTWAAFASGSDNWTVSTGTINAPWQSYVYAMFTATSGTVTVDNTSGQVTLGGATFSNTDATGYIITGGSIAIGGTSNIVLNTDTSGTTTIASILTGTSGIIKTGTGALILNGANTYTGTTTLAEGKLAINGIIAGSATTAANTTLAGSGTIAGPVNVNGTLAPSALQPFSPSVLSTGALTLANTAIVQSDLNQTGVKGGANDFIQVNGDLVLGGTLNVSTSAATFGGGLYHVMDYTGTLTNNTLALGTLPATNTTENYFVQTSVAHEVNLFYFGGSTSGTAPYSGPTPQDPNDPTNFNGKVNYWDGLGGKNDNNVAGGNGTWKSFASGSDNWTVQSGSVNAPWQRYTYAMFTATGGTVTVDNSSGQVTLGGADFTVPNYVITGGSIAIGGTSNIVLNTANTGTTTIASVLTGTAGLIKQGQGTLVLTATNTYGQNTQVAQGTLAATNLSAVSTGSVGVAANATFEYRNIASGTTQNTIAGSGTLAFQNANLTVARDNPIANVAIRNSTVALTSANALGGSTANLLVNSGTINLAANNIALGNLTFGATTPTISFTQPASLAAPVFKTATVNTILNSGGVFNFNIDFTKVDGLTAPLFAADYISITGNATGSQLVTINSLNLGGVTNTRSNAIDLIGTTSGNVTFSLADGVYTVGSTQYRLAQGTTGNALMPDPLHWYLFNEGISAPLDVITTTIKLMSTDWFYALDSLHQRMGDVRLENLSTQPRGQNDTDTTDAKSNNDHGHDFGNIWVRARGYRMNSSTLIDNSAFTQYGYGVTAGADKSFVTDKATNLIGGLIDMGGVSQDFNTHGNGHVTGVMVGAYLTHLRYNGWYADLVAKVGRAKQTFDVRSNDTQSFRGDYSVMNYGLSLEIGRMYIRRDGWWVEPNLQAASVWYRGTSFDITTVNNPVHVDVDAANAQQYRAQVRFGRQYKDSKWYPYGKFAAVAVDSDRGNVKADDYMLTQNYDGKRVEFGFGTTYRISKNSEFYFDYEYAKAAQYERPWGINLGYRRTW